MRAGILMHTWHGPSVYFDLFGINRKKSKAEPAGQTGANFARAALGHDVANLNFSMPLPDLRASNPGDL